MVDMIIDDKKVLRITRKEKKMKKERRKCEEEDEIYEEKTNKILGRMYYTYRGTCKIKTCT